MSCLLDELKKIEHFVGDEFSRFEVCSAGLFNHFREKEDIRNVIEDLTAAEIFFMDTLESAEVQKNIEAVKFIGMITDGFSQQLELNARIIKSISKDADEYIKSQGQTS